MARRAVRPSKRNSPPPPHPLVVIRKCNLKALAARLQLLPSFSYPCPLATAALFRSHWWPFFPSAIFLRLCVFFCFVFVFSPVPSWPRWKIADLENKKINFLPPTPVLPITMSYFTPPPPAQLRCLSISIRPPPHLNRRVCRCFGSLARRVCMCERMYRGVFVCVEVHHWAYFSESVCFFKKKKIFSDTRLLLETYFSLWRFSFVFLDFFF